MDANRILHGLRLEPRISSAGMSTADGSSRPTSFQPHGFRDKFNRPDVVRLVLKTLDEGQAVKQANEAAHKRDDTQPLIERLPPVITILSPTEGSTAAAGTVEVRYRTRMPSGRRGRSG